MNVRGQIGIISSGSPALRIAGTLRGAGLGQGGLIADLRPTRGGYAGTLTIVDGSGSLVASLRASARTRGTLVHLSATAPVTGASGRLRGARGTLRWTMILTGDGDVGAIQLAGNLRGAAGRAPGPAVGSRALRVDARMQGTSVALARNGQETIVGAVSGVVPGPAVVVLRVSSTARLLHSAFTIFAAAGTVTGRIDLRRGSGGAQVRTDTGTAVVTGGTGAFLGAHTVGPAVVRGTRDLVTQLIELRIRGELRL